MNTHIHSSVKHKVQAHKETFLWTIENFRTGLYKYFKIRSVVPQNNRAPNALLTLTLGADYSGLDQKLDQTLSFNFSPLGDMKNGDVVPEGRLTLNDKWLKNNANGCFQEKCIKIGVSLLDGFEKKAYCVGDVRCLDFNTTTKSATYIYKLPCLNELWNKKEIYVQNDTLRIQVDIILLDETQEGRDFIPTSLQSLSLELSKMLDSGEGADITINCKNSMSGGGEADVVKIQCHKLILTARSPVFGRMLATNMKEAETGVVTLEEGPAIIKIMLQYIYSGMIDLDVLNYDNVIQLAEVSDKYELLELKNLCFTFLTRNIDINNCGEIAVSAYQHNAEFKLRETIYNFVGRNFCELGGLPNFQDMLEECPSAFKKPVQQTVEVMLD